MRDRGGKRRAMGSREVKECEIASENAVFAHVRGFCDQHSMTLSASPAWLVSL